MKYEAINTYEYDYEIAHIYNIIFIKRIFHFIFG